MLYLLLAATFFTSPKSSLVYPSTATHCTSVQTEAVYSDTSTVDELISATYDVISGEAGPGNWSRFQSLFLPDARMGATVKRRNGETVYRSFTPADYQKNNKPAFLQSAFYEEELVRQITVYGNVAQVASSYQYRLSKGGKIEQRGINYFTLVKSGKGWYISSLVWQDETRDLPLLAAFIK